MKRRTSVYNWVPSRTYSRSRKHKLVLALGVATAVVLSSWAMVYTQFGPLSATVLAPAKQAQRPASSMDQEPAFAVRRADKRTSSNVLPGSLTRPGPDAQQATSDLPNTQAAQTASAGQHKNIVTTVFWVGEAADASNAFISNSPSAWDELWQDHFGGYDDPARRNGWHPAGFAPKENPFYFALPYNDYDAYGKRRASAAACTALTGASAANTSWCKNAWIKISKAGKSTYAQWQDVGPMHTNDTDYVFGSAQPQNTWGAKAGLDVSPAVRDYLLLKDIDKVDWTFVKADEVPAGPWKQTVTTSGVFWQ